MSGRVKRRASGLHLNPKQVEAIMGQMQGDVKFQVFFDYLFGCRETAINDVCNTVISDPSNVFVTIGEIRAYTEILTLAGNPQRRPADPEADAPEASPS